MTNRDDGVSTQDPDGEAEKPVDMNEIDPETGVARRFGKVSPAHHPFMLGTFRPRKSDVIITTAAKSGTTWMQNILHQIRSGGDTEFGSIFEVVPWLEMVTKVLLEKGVDVKAAEQEQAAAFERISDRRIFKTHCTSAQTPGVDVCRIILTVRDPRDVCVSMWHHWKDMDPCPRPKPANFEEHFEQWMGFGGWYRSIISWWPLRDEENVLLMRYTDLKSDFSGSLDQILQHLDIELDEPTRERVIEYSSFEWMKTNRDKFTRFTTTASSNFPKGFIRKGVVGDHKELLTPAMERRIVERASREIGDDCMRYLGLDLVWKEMQ
eukprot:TRINITY_DN9483_c0_g1_i1.p1 TRINITY_DN9483_c0_g1~~TRINITY_DN9483_c0_g1_i1.p1  ORF type:complete len:334 (+),score=68.73 TRINITY_DN9483_c0_g1_i1:38-1003(+)